MKKLTYKQMMLYKYLEGCFKADNRAFISKKRIAYEVGYKFIDLKDRNCVDIEFDVREINDNPSVPKIIVSNSKGYKIGTDKEIEKYLIKRYKRDFKSLNLTHKIENKLKLNAEEIKRMKNEAKSTNSKKYNNNIICKCPICENNILTGEYGYYCSNKECKVSLRYHAYKYAGYDKKLSASLAKELFTSGESKKEVKCHSTKTDKDFSAILTWTYSKDEQYPNKTGLKFKNREEEK